MVAAIAEFGAVNTAVLVVYMLAMLAVGFLFVRRQNSSEEFFLAGRSMPWLPVAMSMYASMTSAMSRPDPGPAAEISR